MNLTKECIRKTNIDGVVYYQMPEIIEEDCIGYVLYSAGDERGIACEYLYEQSAQCSDGVWTTKDHKETYCVQLMTH